MIIEHRPRVDIQTVQHLCHDLVCRIVSVLLFQADVVPDHIIGIVQVPAFQILGLQVHGGQVVSVKYDDRRLSPFLHGFQQIPGKLIHLVYFIHIIFPGISPAFVLHAANLNSGVLDHLLHRIIPVPLNADGEYKVLTFRRIHGIHDVWNQDVVRGPPLGSGLEDIHKFLAGVMVKPHMVEHLCPAVKISSVVVQRLGPVSQIGQGCGRAFQKLRLCVGFIGIFPRPEETHAHTRQHFKFRVGRTRAYGRHFKVPAGILLIHLPQVGDRVLRELQPLHLCGIKV